MKIVYEEGDYVGVLMHRDQLAIIAALVGPLNSDQMQAAIVKQGYKATHPVNKYRNNPDAADITNKMGTADMSFNLYYEADKYLRKVDGVVEAKGS
jgi:hypothetical protein